jgi:ATP-dependent helicase HrpA
VAALKQLEAEPIRSTEQRNQLNTYRWMVEEYKVSLFAQELGTAIPVSSKRLDAQLAATRQR